MFARLGEGVSAPHIHEHHMIPWNDLRKGDCCGSFEATSDGYYCERCDVFVHKKCGGLSLPLIHEHLMISWNDTRKGDCCGRFEATSDGYYCKSCDFFVHKKCGESPQYITHPSHSFHSLWLCSGTDRLCDICGRRIVNLYYSCLTCDFCMDLHCVRYPLQEVIDISETHGHKLILQKELTEFYCHAKCGETGDGFPYKCHECDLTFHGDCVGHPLEVKHPYHPLHPLKLLKGRPPHYSDGKCRLCGESFEDGSFYHCSSCNFSLDLRCVLKPPPRYLIDLNVHDHQLILVPKPISFICSACALDGDRSPYVCLQCDFMIHNDCLHFPRLININRHDHRISRTSLLGAVKSVCGVCRRKVDWTCGGYCCRKCREYVVHSKCATRKDVWNGKELESIPEEKEDTMPYVIIDENTIHHFSHQEHYLRLNKDGILQVENKCCKACSRPIQLQSFYGCVNCAFLLHENCAQLPKKKWHVLHNERLTLVVSKVDLFACDACHGWSNGFRYKSGNVTLDVQCGSISEPFHHPSHPQHPLFFTTPDDEGVCNGCNEWASPVLKCIEDDCEFVLDFKCATSPQQVKHRAEDHPLSLRYGEKARGTYWCDICEKETNPKTWFYTSKDHQACLHTKCVLGDFSGLMPRSIIGSLARIHTSYEVVLNSSVSRPLCRECKSHCTSPIILKMLGSSNIYFCSIDCEKGCNSKMVY